MLHERRSLVDRGACEGAHKVCNTNGLEVASQLTLQGSLECQFYEKHLHNCRDTWKTDQERDNLRSRRQRIKMPFKPSS